MERCCEMKRSAAELRRRLRGQAGFTLIELLAAISVLTVGVFAVGTTLASSRAESSGAETQQAEIHRGQKEIERIEALPYSQVGLTAAPTTSTSATDPRYYVGNGTCPAYQYNQTAASTNNTEPLVIDGCTYGSSAFSGGAVSAGPTAWSDGRLGGNIHDFVTWVTDSQCGSGCPSSSDYKRVTVAVTNSSGSRPFSPVLVSTIIADPHASPGGSVSNGSPNILSSPTVNCKDSSGQTVSCTSSVGSSKVNVWYLTDTAATNTYQAPIASHPTHTTIAPSGTCTAQTTSGCPVPDLLNATPPPSPSPAPPLYNYSNEQTDVSYAGGRAIFRDVACGSTPSSTDNTKGELLVTAPLSAAISLTGGGGMTLNTQTLNGASGSVTLCVAIDDVPNSISNLVASPPKVLGVVAYTLASWPTSPTPLSFTFNFSSSGSVSVPAGDRIGARIWVDPASGADIAAIYDHPSFASQLQLESQ
jgi:prepilin-type N-terminal cleavage/methylation domain-containing protein